MRLDIRATDFAVTDALREHTERRVRLALGRFVPRVRRVTARLADTNGPRGGLDKVCRLQIRVTPGADLHVDDADRDLYTAIARAAERAGRAVQRHISRDRSVGPASTIAARRVVAAHPSATTESGK